MSHYATTSLIFALSAGHSDITRFRPRSPVMTGNHLDLTEKIPKVAQTTGTVDVFDPRSGISGPTSLRASACPNLLSVVCHHMNFNSYIQIRTTNRTLQPLRTCLVEWLTPLCGTSLRNAEIHIYTGCHRRKGPNFGRVFLMLNYTDITQNTYIQS